MPCNTPPPPPYLADVDDVIEDDDDLVFEMIDDAEILEMPPEDQSVLTFSGHKDAVFCCNFNKPGSLVVSGGQDEKAYVWDVMTGEVKFEVTGHSESVIAADFSVESSLVATADMNGIIQAWNVESQSKVWSFEASEINWMQWHQNSDTLFAGTDDGSCWKWTSDGLGNVFPGPGCGSICGTILPDGNSLVSGYADGSLRLWNINELSVTSSLMGSNAHKKAVTCVKSHPNDPVFLTGSEDGTAKLVRSTNTRVLWSLPCCSSSNVHEDSAVESVGFIHNIPLVATGSNCGCFTIWDSSAQAKRFSLTVEGAIVKIICCDNSPFIYVGTSKGRIEVFDGRTGAFERDWVGHQLGILDFSISRDWDKMVSASEDTTCKIFSLR